MGYRYGQQLLHCHSHRGSDIPTLLGCCLVINCSLGLLARRNGLFSRQRAGGFFTVFSQIGNANNGDKMYE